MKLNNIKELLRRSLDPSASVGDIPEQLGKEGVSIDFRSDFNDRISSRIFGTGAVLNIERERVRTLNYVFTRIALTGVAAILILLISIFLTEGYLSLDSFLGLNDTAEESMVFLLTGM